MSDRIGPDGHDTEPESAGVAGLALSRLAGATREAPVALGRYDVVGRLGQGGMGTVYEAIDRERGTRVALKTLSVADAAAGVRLKREFRAVADLAHPNLATAYELASVDGLWFFAMERIDGVGFTRWARGPARAEHATAPLPMTQAAIDCGAPTEQMSATMPADAPLDPRPLDASPPNCTMAALRAALAELTRGLAALHDNGLWHGDIKPDNVLVRGDGRVVVVDFGLAEAVGAGRRVRGPTAGTPMYMAPEQLSGHDAGPAADWYAVGTLLYEALTGRLPFDADSLLNLYFQKSHQTPPSPRELLPELPADLSDACMALLGAAPDRRPGGAELLRLFAGDEEAGRRLAERPVRSVFVGRKRELRLLEQAYGLARTGQPMVVHAIGPSGIGKTAMLRSFGRGVEDVDGALVLRGRCYERESVPYKGFDGIMDELAERLRAGDPFTVARMLPAWIAELAQVFPALASVPAIASRQRPPDDTLDAVELRRRAWTALRELFAALAADHVVVLSIDDLQWADADSANLLESLVAEAGRKRLLVVVSYRPAEAAASPALRGYLELCRRLDGERRLVEIAVGPLPPAEAELLARAALRGLGGAASEGRLRFLTEEAAGVPFFIEELARFAAGREGALDRTVSLDDAIRARLAALPAEQRALLETAAVADSPVPQSLAFEAAGLDAGALPALLALRSASMLSWGGAGADDPVAVYHDRIRAVVSATIDDDARARRHGALGRALAARHAADPHGPWVFEAVRHLAGARLDDRDERLDAARLAAIAGRAARHAAAFPLAFACFERGIALLAPGAWTDEYALALELHGGAAEAAYLSAEWSAMAARCAEVKAHARGGLDALIAWEVEIDAAIGRHQYLVALDAGRSALALFGVSLPREPGAGEIGAAFTRALGDLARVGPDGLAAMADADDPSVAATMRLLVRLSPAAYFGQPMMLPMIACEVVSLSVARGLAPATPYALAVFGIVLNTVDQFPVSHRWGQLALALIERWPDRRLEAATRHIIHNLVCSWMVPLSSVLAPLREVWDIGRRTGDLEYASYAAHAYTHNALYAGRPLEPLYGEALALGVQMRALGQVNAVHVHAPFEQLLRALTGRLAGAPCLDDDGFSEDGELAAAARDGSRSGTFVLRLVMGMARYFFGDRAGASAQLEIARAHLDAAPSTWHVPMLHQLAGLATCASGAASVDADLAALRALAAHAPVNFAHKVALLEAAVALRDGDRARARTQLDDALAAARAGDWSLDVALALDLAARLDDTPAARDAARDAFTAWGAVGVASRSTT